MKKAGCYLIQIGIESGNNEILRAMRKNITIEDAFRACRIIKRAGLELHTFFMVGFPQEREDTLNDTLMAMKKIDSDLIIYSIFNPYPGTEAFEFCKAHGLVGNDYDVSLHNHNSPNSHFCADIKPQRFRQLASRIEQIVDKKNELKKIRRSLSLNTIWRIQELGIRESLKQGVKIFTRK